MTYSGLSHARAKTRKVRIGKVSVGETNPVRIKGMLKTPTANRHALCKEASSLEAEGAEAIRLAVKQAEDAPLIRMLRKHISIPVVADIHFDARLALLAIEEGFDGIRLNPLNIQKRQQVKEVVRAAKKRNISIRIGINSGGFKKDFASPGMMAKEMVKVVARYVRIFEREGFFDTIVSLKASDVETTLLANKAFSKAFDYPLHVGVTATGSLTEGIVKSSLGIGLLLREGIGDVIRVSLTERSFWEIRVAKLILQSLGLRRFTTEIVSCPTCSRCEVDLVSIVEKVKQALDKEVRGRKLGKIAIMGCVVNGPGEAYQADIGVAFGAKRGAIFRKDKIVGYTTKEKVAQDLIKHINNVKSA